MKNNSENVFVCFQTVENTSLFEETSNLGKSLNVCPNELIFRAIRTEFDREATLWLRLLRGL